MVEWFKAHAWKACEVQASAGSNPVLCAKRLKDHKGLFFMQVNNQYLNLLGSTQDKCLEGERKNQTRSVCPNVYADKRTLCVF